MGAVFILCDHASKQKDYADTVKSTGFHYTKSKKIACISRKHDDRGARGGI